MSESTEQKIARLMSEGLDHYGEDRLEQAAACWRGVLRMDPEHEEARDYLRTAGLQAEEEVAEEESPVLREALDLFRMGDLVEALELLETLPPRPGTGLEAHGYIELIRSTLYDQYLAEMAGGVSAPRVVMTPDQIMRFNLPADAGFVLSMMDGRTGVNDIVALSGMDPFEAMRLVHKLCAAGIVEAAA